jgi:transcriptional regulator with XRE-family HTH domain
VNVTGWNQKQMAKALGISDSRYSEFVNGKRRLTYAALCKAFEIGVPPDVLLQTPKTRREYEKRQHNDVPSEELKQP